MNQNSAEGKGNGLAPQLERLHAQLQEREKEVTALLEQAFQYMHQDVKKARTLFQKAKEEANTVFDLYEKVEKVTESLHETMGPLYSEIEEMQRRQAAMGKAMLLGGIGTAEMQLGNLSDAQKISEEALSFLGKEANPVKGLLWENLGIIYQMKGFLNKADDYYESAFNEYTKLEMWEGAARTKSLKAGSALIRGDHAGFFRLIDEAIAFARSHKLPELERKIRNMKTRHLVSRDVTGEDEKTVEKELLQTKEQSRDESETDTDKHIDKLVDYKLLDADYQLRYGSDLAVERRLQEVLRTAKIPEYKQWSMKLSLAEACESQGDIDKAIEYVEDAHEIAKQLGIMDMVHIALEILVLLRWDKGTKEQRECAIEEINSVIEQLRSEKREEYLAETLLQRALLKFQDRKLEAALADIEEAEKHATTPGRRFGVLFSKSGTLKHMGRKEEALTANLQAINLFEEQFSSEKSTLPGWRYRLDQIEGLYEGATLLAADLNRFKQAFEFSDNGKAWLLRHQLTQTALATKKSRQESGGTFEGLRALLARESATMVQFCVVGKRTLLLVLDPRKQDPEVFSIELSENELKTLFSSRPNDEKTSRDGNRIWEDIIRNALPELSEKFMPKLRDVAENCDLLYLVPNSLLFFVPFAALTSKDGTPLVKHCALVYTPSAAVLEYCFSRRTELKERTCLAFGVGEASDDDIVFSFAEHAREIADLNWEDSKWLLPEATKEQFLEAIKNYNVLHLSCHGFIDETVHDSLSASYIQFANNQELTARDIFNIGGHLNADLVFLNACLSGKFRLHLESEVGGFWQGFLHAGARSLITTLASVNPESAQELAMKFYQQWLSGNVTKAEALRRAQLSIYQEEKKEEKEKKDDPLHWASHILIGDHR
jgi:CHAT domain-containing protein